MIFLIVQLYFILLLEIAKMINQFMKPWR